MRKLKYVPNVLTNGERVIGSDTVTVRVVGEVERAGARVVPGEIIELRVDQAERLTTAGVVTKVNQ